MWPFRRRERAPRPNPFRYERFGGIAQLGTPRALVFMDRERARSLGYAAGGAAWQQEEPAIAEGSSPLDEVLSAPLEAHLQLTNRCDAGCQGCYTGASPQGERNEWGLEAWKKAIDELAARGVFHLALGGGESAVLPWLGEIAEYARQKGLVPNLTTSGLAEVDRLVEWAPLFGQINVSIDGVGEVYERVRGFDGFARADEAIVKLRKRTKHVGINCVVTRENFDHLDELFAYAKRRKLREVELLRFKPSGRGAKSYGLLRCSNEQHAAFLPLALRLARKYRRRVRLDCSYTPMITAHGPDPKLVRWLAIYGCAGGDLLIGAKAHGVVTACSFAAPPPGGTTVDRLGEYWQRDDAFGPFRRWKQAQEPCRSCDYLALCRGGCRVVSAHVSGDASAPDPECPRVIAWRAANPTENRKRLPVVS